MPTEHSLLRPSFSAIDLFAGCGGLTVGLKRAGFTVRAAIELEKLAIKTYRHNHPDVAHVYGQDICTVAGERILTDLGLARGELDLLAGCPPCQGFSRVNTLNGRRGGDDPRNDLVFQVLRLVEELLPRGVLMENVPALRDNRRYRMLRERLQGLGYHVTDAVHDAADFGVPQRRRRLILLAARGAVPTLPAPVGPSERTTVRTTIGAIVSSAGTSGDPAHDIKTQRRPHVEALIARIPRDGGSRRDLGPEAQLACHRRCDGFLDVYGRMRWDDVAPTITGGFVSPSKGRFLHPTAHRTITPREAALLQTFSADYSFPMEAGKYPVACMIGNAFPPRLAEAHARAMAEALERRPSMSGVMTA